MTINTEPSTFVQLRALLDQAEREIVAVQKESQLAAQVIRAVEQAEGMLAHLHSQGIDVRAEEGRAASLRGRLLREARRVQQRIVQSHTAATLAESALWREIVATEAARQARARRNLLLTIGGIVIVALLLFVVLPWAFPVAPTANTIAVGQLAAGGDLASALARAQAEQAQAPNDPQIYLWIAALQQQLGQQQSAASWLTARTHYSNAIDFLSEKTMVLLALGDLANAEQTANLLRATPGGEAFGLFHLGSIRESQRRNREAIDFFQQASALAEQENRLELAVTARTRMATLMQMGQ